MELLKKRSIGGLEAATTAKEVLAERASSAIRRAGRSIRHVVVELIYYRPYYVESAQNIPSNSCSRRLYQTGSEFCHLSRSHGGYERSHVVLLL